ncbi:hypothetical protein [Sorangium sp. So ce117]|uniref:hypothetical protein n=1 Tax=Sorangium sp. So ce117 TaxID=3133277 RepID=UPI003F5DDC1F
MEGEPDRQIALVIGKPIEPGSPDGGSPLSMVNAHGVAGGCALERYGAASLPKLGNVVTIIEDTWTVQTKDARGIVY